MSILETIKNLFQASPASGNRFLDIHVLNFRCNEPISAQVDLYNDLSPDEEGRDKAQFYVRKVLSTSGRQRCYDSCEVQVWLDGRRRVVEYEVTGGKWLEESEYEAALTRFNSENSG